MDVRVCRGGKAGRWFSDDARHAAHFGAVHCVTLRWDAESEVVHVSEDTHPGLYALGAGEDAVLIQAMLNETGAAVAILHGWEGAGNCYYVSESSDWVIVD